MDGCRVRRLNVKCWESLRIRTVCCYRMNTSLHSSDLRVRRLKIRNMEVSNTVSIKEYSFTMAAWGMVQSQIDSELPSLGRRWHYKTVIWRCPT